jgi:uncharacterized membrane protein YdjX (TVP38/TMEM64 family)
LREGALMSYCATVASAIVILLLSWTYGLFDQAKKKTKQKIHDTTEKTKVGCYL